MSATGTNDKAQTGNTQASTTQANDLSSFQTALPGYFTASEASKVLGYSNHSYIARLIRDGKIPAYKVGTIWLIPAKQVELLLSQVGNAFPTRGQARG